MRTVNAMPVSIIVDRYLLSLKSASQLNKRNCRDDIRKWRISAVGRINLAPTQDARTELAHPAHFGRDGEPVQALDRSRDREEDEHQQEKGQRGQCQRKRRMSHQGVMRYCSDSRRKGEGEHVECSVLVKSGVSS